MRNYLILALILLITGCKTTTSYYYNPKGVKKNSIPIARIDSNTETESTMTLPDGAKFTHNAKSESFLREVAKGVLAGATAKEVN